MLEEQRRDAVSGTPFLVLGVVAVLATVYAFISAVQNDSALRAAWMWRAIATARRQRGDAVGLRRTRMTPLPVPMSFDTPAAAGQTSTPRR